VLRWRSWIFRFLTTVWAVLEVSCYPDGGSVVVFVVGGLDFSFCSFRGGGDIAPAVCVMVVVEVTIVFDRQLVRI
jgi:hypothetical protein